MRDDLNMQDWVEDTIRAVSMPARGRKSARGLRRHLRGTGATTARPEYAAQSIKQIIVRVDDDLLQRLRQAVGTSRGSASRWLMEEISRYVASHDLDVVLLLPPGSLNAIKDVLPKDETARQAVVCDLLDLPYPVMASAVDDGSLGLRGAIRDGDAGKVREILELAAKKTELREQLARFRQRHA